MKEIGRQAIPLLGELDWSGARRACGIMNGRLSRRDLPGGHVLTSTASWTLPGGCIQTFVDQKCVIRGGGFLLYKLETVHLPQAYN